MSVRRIHLPAVMVLLGAWLVGAPLVNAQQGVCVVDVAEVFRSHSGFNQSIENLKQQAEQYKIQLQQQGEMLRSRSEQLKELEIGSPEYKQLESDLAQSSAQLEVERRTKTREFVQYEAQLHYDTYLQVTQVIASICEQRGYRLAMRIDGTAIDPSNPDSIMQHVNENVIFHSPMHNITQEVIQGIQAQAGRTGQVGGSGERR